MHTVKTTLEAVECMPPRSYVGIYIALDKDLDIRELSFTVCCLSDIGVSLLQLRTKRSTFDSAGFHLCFPAQPMMYMFSCKQKQSGIDGIISNFINL